MALKAVAEDLRLPAGVTLRWFSEESARSARMRKAYGGVPWRTFTGEPDTRGITFGTDHKTMWLAADLDGLDVVEVVFHEARHVAQYERYLNGAADAIDPEDDAAAERDMADYPARFLDRCEAEAEAYEDPLAGPQCGRLAPVIGGASH